MPDWLEISLRTLSSVVILFIITKLLGKRQISQLSLFEYITGITMGNIAAYISLDLDNDWYLGIVSLAVWVGISVAMEFITLKSKSIRDVVDGRGTVLIDKGVLLRKNMRKERITLDEMLEQLRKKDVYRVADVEFAIMEQSGEINVMLKKEHQPLTPDMLGWRLPQTIEPQTVVMDGHAVDRSLEVAGKDRNWLKRELEKQKVKMEEVFLAQIDSQGELAIQTGTESKAHNPSTKPKDQIAELLKQYEDELYMLERFAMNEDDKLDYRDAINKLKTAMHFYPPPS
ncbi:DUF421 domain-containing protein [Paenibacillus radicis (ex Gao et al. 2016)]|uniref:YetF C-terminal domain-containing protein n=1 Tax=Paenibacillus radicis (ex Gao et al. 2016) TaxID=1737354 RepID=A0A917LXK4_9BACL|nr:DUF421 domain-containing protein [Paenibacillus radicis (ex Gao et al. 2016)]GGG62390.1 hypothetical protein GCM10010918_15120 [Paenibacillus radicis (ex Gao et al. 2016)]